MKDSTASIIKAAIGADDSMSDAEREFVLAACRGIRPAAQAAAQPERWLTPAEVADMLTLSVRTVRRWIASGTLVSKRFGRVRRIPESSLPSVTPLPHVGGRGPTAGIQKSA